MTDKFDTKDVTKLTPLQYFVTQQNGTEPPFKNEFYANETEGLYVDIVSGKSGNLSGEIISATALSP